MVERHEIPKQVKRLLRQWAGVARERDLRRALKKLSLEFGRWERGEVDTFVLHEAVHKYHDRTARAIWNRYATNNLEPAVAFAVVTGVIRKDEVPPALLEHLARAIAFYEDQT